MSPANDDWQNEIRQLEEEGCTAFLAQDLDRLRQLWADDLAVNSPINRIHTRDQVLDLLGRGIIRHVSMEQTIELLTRHGDVVVVMGHDLVRDTPDGPLITRRFTNVWTGGEGSWRLLARQVVAHRGGVTLPMASP
jgi:ketosteroid isomerase-like protein